jgi:hypothetical protein
MRRKDYMEVSLEPKYYVGSDYSDDRSLSSWAAAGMEDNDLYYWEEVPKEKTPKPLTAVVTPMTMVTLEMSTLSGCIRCVVRLAVTPSWSSTHRSTNVSRPWRR